MEEPIDPPVGEQGATYSRQQTSGEAPAGEAHGPLEPADNSRLLVVGIGASAGGLTPLQGFFDALPADTGMAFAVVTHMDPEKESLLAELLQKHTAMPVRQVSGLAPLQANHVYVIPPGHSIVVTATHLDVERFTEPRGQRMPIDQFFRSLAAAHREAAAIILSGGGTDGSVGVKAIKEEGGLLLVQDPDEAEYDSMPRAAIATGLADMVLPVAELAAKLAAYRRNGVHVPRDPQALTESELETVYRILTQVQAHTGHDFSQYKQTTILRRIQRRLMLHGFVSLEPYLDYLRHEPQEATALFNDLLIGVTNFFRDQDSWQALAEQVMPRLFEGKGPADTIRVWSIGCATGEEAYTLAILLLEASARLEPVANRPGIQVFASDLDDDALHRAREGIYPEAIEADVSPERLSRFFIKEGHYYRTKRELRDSVLFSNHSVLRDPPFSRLDLISCRNLLIYLNRDLQDNVFQIFHYALHPEHYLFLGSSESAETVNGLFRTVDKIHRIYQARPWRGDQPHVPSLPLAVRGAGLERRRMAGGQRPAGEAAAAATGLLHQKLLEAAAPPSLLVDDQYHILHISESAGRYLLHPRGVVTTDLLQVVRPELQFDLRAALRRAFHEGKAVLSHSIYVRFNGTARRVIVAVAPTHGAGDPGEKLALVYFLEDDAEEAAAPAEAGSAAPEPGQLAAPGDQRDVLIAQLEAEVRQLREHLQTSTEEYESSNEELKAANEELQSINEEYRSTTEELETSKEELQSVNEELQTVNAELKNKLEEISRAHSDVENLMVATEIPTLFLDRELRIGRYTPATAELFNLMLGDRGRPIAHLTNRLLYENLQEDAARVLRTLVPIEREVQDVDGRWLLARLRPYRSVDDRIEGVVLTLVDISALKSAEAAVRAERDYSDKIVHTVREGMLVLTPDLTVEFANQPFYELFGVQPEQTIGSLIYDLGDGQWDIPELRRLLEEILPGAKIFNDYRVEHTFENVGRRILLLNARRLDEVERLLLAIEDITEREQYEQELRASEARLRKVLSIGTVGVIFFDTAGTVVDANDTFLRQVGYSRSDLEAGALSWQKLTPPEWLEESRRQLATMGNDGLIGPYEKQYLRKDGSRWWFLFAGARLDDATLVEYVIDISRQKEAETALRERERELAALNATLEQRVQQRTEQVRNLAGQLTMAEHEERARIAEVLHDDLQQQLYALQIQLSFLRAEAPGETMRREIDAMEKLLLSGLETARQLSVDLSPPILEGEGLAEAIQWLGSHMQQRYGLKVMVSTSSPIPVSARDRRVLLFQMVRELLFNVVKHAGVSEAEVRLGVRDDPQLGESYHIEVIDGGAGFDVATVLGPGVRPDGRGLLHLRERLRLVGGRLEVQSIPGDGTRITMIAPVRPAAAGPPALLEEE
jgi:two-component system, chemotaxis family, CheB/CheR fusion protein